MASCVLNSLAQGNYSEAALLAMEAARNAESYVEADANALAAAALLKAGKIEASLAYWDKLVCKKPQQLNWLAPALQTAWQYENQNETARKYARQWLALLERVFIATPPLPLLLACRQRGWQGIGSIGAHQGKLSGWLLLPINEKAQIYVNLPVNAKFSMSMQPAAAADNLVLYSLDQKLPEEYGTFQISITDANGKHAEGSPLICSPARQRRKEKPGKKRDNTLTILIPVYDDARATLRCIGTVLTSLDKNSTPARVVAIWDQGPDQELLRRLRNLARKQKIILAENAANMGFLASINQALANFACGDIILLNADTLVHGNWIDRMLKAAKPDAATVTALSNEAEHMSFPSVFDRSKVTSLKQLAILDRAASMLPPEESSMEIPVGIGFCMLITRQALAKVGFLDGLQIFRGYGEEVDYCLRAREAGLKNYGAFNVFVAHLGEKSFGLAKKAYAAQNNAAIKKRFPDYVADYEKFIHLDYPASIKERISRHALLHLTGMPKLEIRPWSNRKLPPWLKDDKTGKRSGAALFLRPGPKPRALLRVWGDIPLADMHFATPEEFAELGDITRQMAFAEIESRYAPASVKKLAEGIINKPFNHLGAAHKLPAPEKSSNMRLFICAPPASLQNWKSLLATARANPQDNFYVFALEELWPSLPLAANIRSFMARDELDACGADGFILPGGEGDLEAWRQWLNERKCGQLPIYGTVRV